jgi:N-succinyldiaminopimelate aminotransferase
LTPAAGAHLEQQTEAKYPGLHRYANPRGRSELIEAIVRSRRDRRGETELHASNVLITPGATCALSTSVRALLAPGEKIMILAPFWPLIRGMSLSHGLEVIEVPLYDRLDGVSSAEAILEAAFEPGVTAIYMNHPNNPSGVVLPPHVVSTIAGFAQRHDLWILTDEIYEDLVYRGDYTPIAPLPEAAGRTVSVYSFSKAWGMAGNRVGYLIASQDTVNRLEQLSTYLFYSTSGGGQLAAAEALRSGAEWLAEARRQYLETGNEAARRLGVPPPDGGTFLFFDVAEQLNGRSTMDLLEECAGRGLLVTPGSTFGSAYPTHIRLSFTSAPPDVTLAGVDLLKEILGPGT